ncbi:MAG: DNA mismatch repair endonuclease MutL, partial [Dehalococcoidia bacterium]
MPIKVLASEVVAKIAAGEVVERPASVVKELIENSLDAGATQIAVEAQGGGVESIKVSDNGIGIATSELELAFHRYATSKIDGLSDLETISSLGFRGEALPSIAAVAEVEILTRTSSEIVGSYMYLRKGEVVGRESRARPQGTTVTVHRLFRYFPARLKFLKSANTENGHIAQLLSHYALAFPEVKFSLVLDKHESLHTTGDGDMREVIKQIYGAEPAQSMLKLDHNDGLAKVSGLISPPSLARSNRNHLSFFVNRRWVYSPLLTRAVEQAYHGLLMDGQHPIAVINVSLP